jgi:hypothetical protein
MEQNPSSLQISYPEMAAIPPPIKLPFIIEAPTAAIKDF